MVRDQDLPEFGYVDPRVEETIRMFSLFGNAAFLVFREMPLSPLTSSAL
jgi:hypothetical protein